MDVPRAEVEGRVEPASSDALVELGRGVWPSPAVILRTVIAGILLAVAGAWISSTVADRNRGVENVEHGDKYRGTKLSIGTVTQNAAVAYGLLGAVLSLSVGVTAGCFLGGFSARRVLIAGLVGLVLGAGVGAGSSYVLTPLYFQRMETADISLTMLIHLGIWAPIGAASGFAFAIGSGVRKRFVESVIGGMVGAALAVLFYDVCGAFFPFARTERPLAEEALTRLAAAVVLSVFVVVGTVVVSFQKPRASVKLDAS